MRHALKGISLERLLLGVLLLGVLLYVGLGFTPSHYGVGFQYLGINDGPLLGTARSIRSDEWIALTPLFQIAVLGEFSPTNVISPYHEQLKGFFALPILDWSLLFKPQLWGFWLLPAGYAYSLYFAFMWSGFLAGYTILLRQFGVPLVTAALGSLILYSSHFVQVWWTSNAPTFSFAAWPLVVFLLPVRPWVKIPLLTWTSGVWVFSFVYPPFLISTAFVLAVLLVAFRRDALTVRNIISGLISAIVVGAAFYVYFGDLIATMAGTIYPGQRSFGGGGVSESQILAHLLPFFTTTQFLPLLSNSNECEIAVVSTLLPLAILVFARHRPTELRAREIGIALLTIGCALGLMMAWMLLPIPADWGAMLLWNKVQPKRMVWGFGLLLTIALIVVSSKLEYKLSWSRLLIFIQVILVAWLVSKIGFTEVWSSPGINAWQALSRSWFDWIPLIPFSLAILAVSVRPSLRHHSVNLMLCAAGVSGLSTFWTFNPVQRAHTIFNLPDSAFLQELRENARTNPNGWAVLPRMYGALLNGTGTPSINHTLMTPQVEFFRRVFPNLSDDQLNQAFNRYAHVIPSAGVTPHSPSPDVVVVPIEAFVAPLRTGP